MSNKNQGNSSHDNRPGGEASCELCAQKNHWRWKFMRMNNNNQPLNKTFTISNSLQGKIICYARNCNKFAVSTLILTAGSKQIPIHVCAECTSKFE